MMDLEAFAHSLVQDVIATAEAEGVSTHDAFTERLLQDLENAGHVEDWYVAYFRAHGVEVSGYGQNEGLGTLDVFLAQFRQEPILARVGSQETNAWAKRAVNYVNKATSGLSSSLDDSLEAFDMANAVEKATGEVNAVRVFLLTNDVSTVNKVDPTTTAGGLPVTFEVWDAKRLHRLASSGILHEPIVVEFADPLACLSTPTTDENYSVFLSIIRGDVLGDIYREYGTRLLELNVRSFLQLKGAVNRGIRETLINSPERFLAYNNGISATASKVEMVPRPGGGVGIQRIHDLQVVNGGQTTASIHNALVRDEADLSKVFVQVKLTVVEPEHLNEIVPEISRFSNTQNKVTVVDFSSNDPYHVELEKITRTLWAPATAGSGQETKWFFERARGQYADVQNRERTPARKKAFRVQYPARQKFLKTDVAKWEHSWTQKPWLVSRGAEKNFRAFMAEQGGKVPTKDVAFVQRLLAKGILFRSTERIVTDQQFGGYRANIVTYTIAKLCNATSQRLDLDRIWRDQGLSDATAEALADLSRAVHRVIVNPPAGTSHVGEWTKKEACWARVLRLDWEPSPSLQRELLDVSKAARASRQDSVAGITDAESESMKMVTSLSADAWFALSKWAKETGNLEGWQRALAYSVGRVLARGSEPTIRQANQAVLILEKATSVGFRP